MDGLLAKSIQHFLIATYGQEVWKSSAAAVGAPCEGASVGLRFNTRTAIRVVNAAAKHLHREPAEIWEDLGTHLVTHPEMETVRRLLRFGGADFAEFLWSLDDLYDRAQLAVQGLDLPRLHLRQRAEPARFRLSVDWESVAAYGTTVAGPLVLGALRAMADDYGALVFMQMAAAQDGAQGNVQIEIDLLDDGFAPGREFHLSLETVE